MLSAVVWVPRGASREEPLQQELSVAEMEALAAKQEELSLAGVAEEGGDAEEEEDAAVDGDEKEEAAQGAGDLPEGVDAELMKQLNMDEYDDEEDGATMFLGGAALTVHEDNSQDPYMAGEGDGDESDDDDIAILASDGVVLIGRTEEEQSTVEVQVYDAKEGALYVHHDITIPSFPLALEWLSANPRANPDDAASRTGSFVAVGTFEPGIEIWNLDVLNVMEPTCTLGGREEPPKFAPTAGMLGDEAGGGKSKKSKKKKKRKQKKQLTQHLLGAPRAGSHTDAVMSLSWHRAQPERLASGSADQTVKLWNVTTQQCTLDMSHHESKVQTLEWNPAEPNVLLSGAYDRRVAVLDVRDPKASAHIYTMDADLESVVWNPLNPALFLAASESGTVACHDVRRPGGGAVFTLRAHQQPCTSVSYSRRLPGLVVTTSLDRTAKVWHIEGAEPRLLCSKDLKIGSLFCSSFDYESPCLLALGGNGGKVAVWDLESEPAVAEQYKLA